MKKMETFALLLILLLLSILLFRFDITCPIKAMTGLSCPGCGMTRAWLSLLQGDLSTALAYHPLFPLPLLLLGLAVFRHRLPRSLFLGLILFNIALILGVYGLRMIDPSDTIVVCRPQDGFILKPWQVFIF